MPIVTADTVFLSASYNTGAVLLNVAGNQPKPIWSSDDALSNHYASSVFKDGYVYGFHGRQEMGQSLRCIELKTGKVQWNVDGYGAGTVTLLGDRLLIVRENGEAVDRSGEAGRLPAGIESATSPGYRQKLSRHRRRQAFPPQ